MMFGGGGDNSADKRLTGERVGLCSPSNEVKNEILNALWGLGEVGHFLEKYPKEQSSINSSEQVEDKKASVECRDELARRKAANSRTPEDVYLLQSPELQELRREKVGQKSGVGFDAPGKKVEVSLSGGHKEKWTLASPVKPVRPSVLRLRSRLRVLSEPEQKSFMQALLDPKKTAVLFIQLMGDFSGVLAAAEAYPMYAQDFFVKAAERSTFYHTLKTQATESLLLNIINSVEQSSLDEAIKQDCLSLFVEAMVKSIAIGRSMMELSQVVPDKKTLEACSHYDSCFLGTLRSEWAPEVIDGWERRLKVSTLVGPRGASGSTPIQHMTGSQLVYSSGKVNMNYREAARAAAYNIELIQSFFENSLLSSSLEKQQSFAMDVISRWKQEGLPKEPIMFQEGLSVLVDVNAQNDVLKFLQEQLEQMVRESSNGSSSVSDAPAISPSV